jgi:hypothetical protein
VVAEDTVTVGALEGGEDLGAATGSGECVWSGERATGDEVSGNEDEVWRKVINVGDDVLKEEVFGEFLEVDI